jgi:hypothetical protein
VPVSGPIGAYPADIVQVETGRHSFFHGVELFLCERRLEAALYDYAGA